MKWAALVRGIYFCFGVYVDVGVWVFSCLSVRVCSVGVQCLLFFKQTALCLELLLICI